MKRRFTILLALTFILVISSAATAGSAFFDTSATTNRPVTDRFTSHSFGGFDVTDTTVTGWAGGSLKVFDRATGTHTDLLGPASYSGYNSFVTLDNAGTSAWVGFTTGGNVDDRIYQVDLSSGTWTHRATMAGNFDIAFSGSAAYVSGLHNASSTSIWSLDTTGSNNHDKIIEVGGWSAGLDFDSAGNVYYASGANGLYRWSASDIASAIGANNLDYTDGAKLSDIELGAYDVEIDDSDNVIFNGNGSYCYTALWNGTSGDGTNYDYLGIAAGANGDWFGMIGSTGDITGDGTLYQSDFYYSGLAEVSVPEPATFGLLGIGGLLFRRRRK